MRKQDFARPELAAIKVDGMTREAFLARATLAAGAVYGLGAVTPFVRKAMAQEPPATSASSTSRCCSSTSRPRSTTRRASKCRGSTPTPRS